ncbi:MAG: hypothetical protein LAT68_11005 [Cyclobacteriaceae bacterium]|nr:hypothetical protein [Cyclobacteriaceae bacterium]MCH8516843.1 hypothetical protein [Cyclobacteriaceae bacterium]
MEKQDILRQRLQEIIHSIADINAHIKDVDFHEFNTNEQMKETVFHKLEEIGQTAYAITQEHEEHKELPIKNLSNFKNAQYNLENEVAIQQIFSILKKDLSAVADEINESSYI